MINHFIRTQFFGLHKLRFRTGRSDHARTDVFS